VINLKCDQDLERLGIINLGGWNMLAFWDLLDSCDLCREAQVTMNDVLNELSVGETEFLAVLSSHG
jgi:hypothetical protein